MAVCESAKPPPTSECPQTAVSTLQDYEHNPCFDSTRESTVFLAAFRSSQKERVFEVHAASVKTKHQTSDSHLPDLELRYH